MNLSALAYKIVLKQENIITILKDNSEIEKLATDIEFFSKIFSKDLDICTFFSYEIPPHSSIPPSSYIVSNRLKSLYTTLNSNKQIVFITNINATIQPLASFDFIVNKTININLNDILSPETLIQKLIDAFYKKTDHVYEWGEFSKRGSIIDIFSPFYDKPLRIEFFDDEIDTIKLIYPQNQKTAKILNKAVILPAKEYAQKEEEKGYCLLENSTFLKEYPFDEFKKISTVEEKDLNGIYKLIKLYENNIFTPENEVREFLKDFKEFNDIKYSKMFPDVLTLDEKIKAIKKESGSLRVIITCGSKTRVERIKDLFSSKELKFKTLTQNPLESSNGIYLSDGYIYEGLKDTANRIAFISFGDMFGRHEYKLKRKKITRAKIESFEKGDKVVHKKYGIGIFKGLKRIKIENKEEDFFEIEFAEQDKIFVPVYNSNVINEYNGIEPISSLRNNKWQTTQDNIKKSIKKILTELVNVYAKRQLIKRTPYNTDLLEIKEFEAMFEYNETPDQTKAIKEIKHDLSKEIPMDRLICGDVSFGKTEVAARAIAIVVFNYKQAVFMVPTTLLSMQHFKSLKERFKNFPIKIALLNRFTTKKEKDLILENLKKGTIDLLIATHSVYSDSIEFANLGLVVVDEEHKFGVKAKEHLKTKYPNVDMLYLSATPIPRTLNMALNSIMDISIIKTPPLERKPIETIISKRKLSLIRDAVLREISRNGRVYFVHNTIEDIDSTKEELDNILPFVRKAIVHAKMPKKQIKSTFEAFNNGDYDMLISTSIIESGLDIKSVDTIIIDNADRFGLSDLYQLRGRVGRSDRIAYAYLLYSGKITQNAKKRLQYMEEFFERGSGFHLALKDMELRGYGNILGKDQSGKMKSIGLSTYMTLIEEAIKELKNQPIDREVEIKHNFDAFISDEFAVADDKVEIYRRLSAINTLQKLEEFEEELKDRFGDIPEPTKNLIYIVSLKIKSKKVFVKKLSLSKTGVIIEFYSDASINTDVLIKIVNEKKGKFITQTSVHFKSLGKNLKNIHNSLSKIFDAIYLEKATAT